MEALEECELEVKTVWLVPGTYRLIASNAAGSVAVDVTVGSAPRAGVATGTSAEATFGLPQGKASDERVADAAWVVAQAAVARLRPVAAPDADALADPAELRGVTPPPPFVAFAGIGPTVSPGGLIVTLHAMLRLGFYPFRHFGIGTEGLLPLSSASIDLDETTSARVDPFLVAGGPRLRLGGGSSLFNAELGANFGAAIALRRIDEGEDLLDERTTFRDVVSDGVAYGSVGLGVRIAQDFYATGGAIMGATFRPVTVPTSPTNTWGQPFFHFFGGLEVRLP